LCIDRRTIAVLAALAVRESSINRPFSDRAARAALDHVLL
jgi:hypothetical protein